MPARPTIRRTTAAVDRRTSRHLRASDRRWLAVADVLPTVGRRI
jgi:hypothetical protein